MEEPVSNTLKAVAYNSQERSIRELRQQLIFVLMHNYNTPDETIKAAEAYIKFIVGEADANS